MFAKLAKHDGLMAAMSRRAGFDLGEALLNGRLNPAEYRGTVVRCVRRQRLTNMPSACRMTVN
ncbi:DUF6455 family protein [Nitratireductor soli]|uniref:DUF6455 family protein n=1 Tax=Nitratireductor soli TaxID=1670619 RepID=UPI000AF939FF|nr:DUF6455 family protein [Nitratireductor soli]